MTPAIHAPFPWLGDAMAYAIEHVKSGVLTVDDCGRIWRCAINVRGSWKRIEPRRAENPGGKGYLRVTLHVPGHGLAQVMAHRLVYSALVGTIPPDRQINHKDLNRQNNAPGNLESVTGAENIQHSYAHGRTAPWSKSTQWRGRPRLSDQQKQSIIEMRRDGSPLKDVASAFGISITHAHRICAGAHHVG